MPRQTARMGHERQVPAPRGCGASDEKVGVAHCVCQIEADDENSASPLQWWVILGEVASQAAGDRGEACSAPADVGGGLQVGVRVEGEGEGER